MEYPVNGKVVATVKYTLKAGTREAMIKEIKDADIEERYRKQPGNIMFNFSVPFTADDTIYLFDIWESKASFEAHMTCDVAPEFTAIKAKYVVATDFDFYD